MTRSSKPTVMLFALLMFSLAPTLSAADHSDAPLSANLRSADIADLFVFLDPNDNSRVIIGLTINGFIVPSEAINFGLFDENLRYRVETEINGDARPDDFMTITFTPKRSQDPNRTLPTSSDPQIATIQLPNGQTFEALTTVPDVKPDPPRPVITEGPGGVLFFAGLVGDPFVNDRVGLFRFVMAQRACIAANRDKPDPRCTEAARAQMLRRRDSFAGYNLLAIALSVPVTMLSKGSPIIGTNFVVERRSHLFQKGNAVGNFEQMDRMATPEINALLVPFHLRDSHSQASTEDDARGMFAGAIDTSLQELGTKPDFRCAIAKIAGYPFKAGPCPPGPQGDFVRLDLRTPNRGIGGGGRVDDRRGPSTDGAGWPNGRRLSDDVVDTLLFLINNGTPLSDGVTTDDSDRRDVFPFFPQPFQPLQQGCDTTEN